MTESWNTFGFTDEQRMMRDSVLDLLVRELPPARIGPIGGGSNEIQRNVIATLLGL